MVGRPGQYQFSFNSGELAPAVLGNTGLKQFYAGAAIMQNVEPVPQGGFRLLPGTRYRGTVPRALDPVTGLPAAKLFEFGLSRDKPYAVVVTPLLATIFRAGVQVATVVLPYVAGDIITLKMVQRFDTMLLFHHAYPIGRLLNNGSDATWSYDTPAFANIPQVQIGGSYSNTVEKWVVYINGTTSSAINGCLVVISVDGEETTTLTYNAVDQSAAIKALIEALPDVDPGLTVTLQGQDGTSSHYEIAFTGGTNEGANFIVSGRIVANADVSLNTWREVVGKLGGEDLFSPTRGYPACGTFYQDRLGLGGFAARETAFALSRTGEYFDLNTLLTSTAAGALLLNLSTDGSEEIVAMAQSKHLVLFTSEADYYVVDRAISATAAPSIVQSSTLGCSLRVMPVKQESGLLYMNRDETILYANTYDAVSDAYVSDPLSLLSSHLVGAIRDMALQKAYTATDSERLWMVRDDGLVVVALLIRNQDVSAFVRRTTDGQVRAVAVDGANLTYWLVDRIVDGVPQLVLETVEDGQWLDGAITVTSGAPQTVIGGLAMHEGASVWAIADGYVEGPFTVAGGSLTLQHASSVVTVGRWTPPVVQTLPLVRDVAEHTVLKRPARVFQVVVDLIATTSLAVGANGRPWRDVALGGLQADAPVAPFSGQKTMSGLAGFSPDGQVVLTQVRPGALQLRNITVEAKI